MLNNYNKSYISKISQADIVALMKEARQNISDSWKSNRKWELEDEKENLGFCQNGNKEYFENYRKRCFKNAEKQGVSKEDLMAFGIDKGHHKSYPSDIDWVTSGILQLREGKLRECDIKAFSNTKLVQSERRAVYHAIMNALDNPHKRDDINYAVLHRSKYAFGEFTSVIDMINKDCPKDKVFTLMATTELLSLDVFGDSQKNMIEKAYENGLNKKQILKLANPEFTASQMNEVMIGYKKGLSDEQVSVYAHSAFSFSQMQEIRRALESGISIDEVKEYAKPSFKSVQIQYKSHMIRKNKINESKETDFEKGVVVKKINQYKSIVEKQEPKSQKIESIVK